MPITISLVIAFILPSQICPGPGPTHSPEKARARSKVDYSTLKVLSMLAKTASPSSLAACLMWNPI